LLPSVQRQSAYWRFCNNYKPIHPDKLINWQLTGSDNRKKGKKSMNHLTRNNIAAAGILVVDDEEPLRGIVVSMLVTAGFECREAANGLEALPSLQAG
jgi:PleD family two-component response regulator